MILNTHPADRKEMAHAISAVLGVPAVYMRAPSFAFQVGTVTVNSDNSIAS